MFTQLDSIRGPSYDEKFFIKLSVFLFAEQGTFHPQHR